MATDWKLAATLAGNEVLRRNPNSLVIVEGMNYANVLSMVKEEPVTLDVPNKLVYSFHLYSWQIPQFDSYEQFESWTNQEFGFVLE